MSESTNEKNECKYRCVRANNLLFNLTAKDNKKCVFEDSTNTPNKTYKFFNWFCQIHGPIYSNLRHTSEKSDSPHSKVTSIKPWCGSYFISYMWSYGQQIGGIKMKNKVTYWNQILQSSWNFYLIFIDAFITIKLRVFCVYDFLFL